jgi:hypothetical protein
MLKASAGLGGRKADKQLPLRPAARAVCKATAASTIAHIGKAPRPRRLSNNSIRFALFNAKRDIPSLMQQRR